MFIHVWASDLLVIELCLERPYTGISMNLEVSCERAIANLWYNDSEQAQISIQAWSQNGVRQEKMAI